MHARQRFIFSQVLEVSQAALNMSDIYRNFITSWASERWDLEARKFGTAADTIRKTLFIAGSIHLWFSYFENGGNIDLMQVASLHRLMHQDPEDFEALRPQLAQLQESSSYTFL